VETNLIEKPIGKLAVSGGAVKVPTKPYEIKTISVEFTGQAQTAASKP
jgi:hypothetical protein